MSRIRKFWTFEDDFHGGGTITTQGLDPWVITDTSNAGTPTYTRVDHGTTGGPAGVAQLLLDSAQTEVQNVCLSFGNILCWDINDRIVARFRVAQGQATIDSATSISFGLTGDRHDTIDSIAQHMLFRLIGSNSVVCESDDGTTDLDDKATGISLSTTYREFVLDAQDLTDVKFFGEDGSGRLIRLAKSVTFDMSAYSGALQPFFQIQKTSDSNGDAFLIDYIEVTGRRNT